MFPLFQKAHKLFDETTQRCHFMWNRYIISHRVHCLKLIRAADKPPKLQERDFSGTAYVPVYVMLPGQLGVINMDCQLVDQDNLLNQVKILKPVNVDGVRHAPQQYNWSGYKCLFHIVCDLKLKLQ
ncbi:Beta-amylase 7, partial [Camellia lanceoleosa]